jgi:hypothetical protein
MRTSIPLLAAVLLAQTAAGQALDKKQLRGNSHLMPGELRLEQHIEMCRGRTLDAVVEVTAKGNGILAVGNLKLRVYDAHDDGAVYANDMATVEFVDLDGDGCKELIVTGALCHHGEKDDAIRSVEPFAFIYKFDANSESFRLLFKRSTFSIDAS